MKQALFAASFLTSLTALGLLQGCGAPQPPVEHQPGDSIPLSTPSATAAPASPDSPAPKATASAAPTASALPDKTTVPRPMGAPMAFTSDDQSVTTTYGSRGGKILIGGNAELTIPAGAVDKGINFTFGLNTGKEQLKLVPYKGQIGDVFRIDAAAPDAGQPKPEGVVDPAITSAGDPFLLKLPLKGKDTANLALSTAKGKYVVISPKLVESGDPDKRAVFELSRIPKDAILHLTSAPPTSLTT